jgi:D-alanine-D-alanine ligase
VPFTGCSASALGVTSDKLLAKQHLLRAGVPTPAVFGAGADEGPWIVKSVWEHASLGIDDSSVVRGAAGVPRALETRRAEFGGDWFAERFVPGRELNVALIAAAGGVRALPVAEIRFEGFPAEKPAIVGYAAKWHTDSFEYRNTVRSFALERELAVRAEGLARDCWELFGLTGYARVDLRVDANGRPWVLEVNANPCLSPDAGFAAALATAGIEYRTAIGWLVDDALSRRAATERRSD